VNKLVDKPFFITQPIQPIDPGKVRKPTKPITSDQDQFSQVLKKELSTVEELKFSRHALERIETRKISLDQKQISRLKEAVDKAQTKGAKESLVLLDDLAFVVSIRNRTVITAVDGDSRRGNVFTNIDSAIIN